MNFRGRLFRYMSFLQKGDASRADAELAQCLRLAEQLRHPRYRWQMTLVSVSRAMMRGDFSRSERLCEEAGALGARVDKRTAEHYFLLQTFVLNRLRGTLHEIDKSVPEIAAQYADIAAYRIGLASFFCAAGRVPEAEQAFESLASNDFRDLPNDAFLLLSLSVLVDLCYHLSVTSQAETLYGLLLPYAKQNVVMSWAAACDGPVSHYLGVLAGTITRWEEAEQHFQEALEMNMKLGALPFIARTQHRYAETLLARDAPGDRLKAERLLAKASATYKRLGIRANAGCLSTRLYTVAQAPDRASGLPGDIVADSSFPGALAPHSCNRVRKEGGFWTITYAGKATTLKNNKGLQLIVHLLGRPGDTVHVIELVGVLNHHLPRGACNLVRQELEEGNLRIVGVGDAGTVVDDRARREYWLRLKELRRELDEAEQINDPGRAERLRAEIDQLTAVLSAAFSRVGRPRAAASAVERARVSVRNNISSAMKAIQGEDMTLWRHLRGAIRTGTFCSYDPEQPVTWKF